MWSARQSGLRAHDPRPRPHRGALGAGPVETPESATVLILTAQKYPDTLELLDRRKVLHDDDRRRDGSVRGPDRGSVDQDRGVAPVGGRELDFFAADRRATPLTGRAPLSRGPRSRTDASAPPPPGRRRRRSGRRPARLSPPIQCCGSTVRPVLRACRDTVRAGPRQSNGRRRCRKIARLPMAGAVRQGSPRNYAQLI